MSSLKQECERAATRARSMRIKGFRYALEGEVVTLEGEALTPDAIDSAVKCFTATTAREVRSRMRHVPPDPAHPGRLFAGSGYVEVEGLGPNGARLAETTLWEVRSGDTLASIATAVYGDPALNERIFRANASQIGADGHIHAGQTLRIPPR